MDEETAYQLTKTFWQQKDKMGQDNAWWNGVTNAGLETLGAKLHPGAMRYYEEAGIDLPAGLK